MLLPKGRPLVQYVFSSTVQCTKQASSQAPAMPFPDAAAGPLDALPGAAAGPVPEGGPPPPHLQDETDQIYVAISEGTKQLWGVQYPLAVQHGEPLM